MNNNYAIVINGIVANIIVWDGVNDWKPSEGEVIPLSDNAGIGWGYSDGKFSPPPEPEKTHNELVEEAIAKKNSLIMSANEFMNGKQWPGKAAIGRLKGEELAQYNLWLDYLDALEAIDTASAPDIKWPTLPASVEG
ncbi:tail fiber assembly protein [Enterobacter hormaechei]|jgi:hypothetical protein|uniref:tail fiber assembly protein n=1 Tax=Enterobacter hormaechei TaxID=158836 RepID=UPI0012B9871E